MTLLLLIETAPDDASLCWLRAGPIDDLAVHHGEALVDRSVLAAPSRRPVQVCAAPGCTVPLLPFAMRWPRSSKRRRQNGRLTGLRSYREGVYREAPLPESLAGEPVDRLT
jgi:hypothetical protein